MGQRIVKNTTVHYGGGYRGSGLTNQTYRGGGTGGRVNVENTTVHYGGEGRGVTGKFQHYVVFGQPLTVLTARYPTNIFIFSYNLLISLNSMAILGVNIAMNSLRQSMILLHLVLVTGIFERIYKP